MPSLTGNEMLDYLDYLEPYHRHKKKKNPIVKFKKWKLNIKLSKFRKMNELKLSDNFYISEITLLLVNTEV